MNKKQDRIIWVDALRGFLIMTVLLGHCSPPFVKYIYGFHMPAFFFLTGYLFDFYCPFREIFKKLFSRIIIPYFLLCFFNLFIQIIFHYESICQVIKYIVGILYSRGTVEWMPNCSPLWFLTCYFCVTVLFFLILMVRITAFRIILLFICPAISYLLYLLNVFKLPWNIDSALMGVLFLWGGYLIRKFDIFSFVKSHKVVTIISGPVLAILGFCCIKFNCCIVSFDDNKYGHFFLMLFGALFWSALLFLAFYNIPKKILRYISILTIFGRNTIIIMGIDYLCGSIVSLFILQYCNKWYWLFILKIVLIGIIVIPWSKTKEKRKSIKL